MKINRNNYETFFVDYLDGKLDEELVNDFIEFLKQNPDLKEELALVENISMEQEKISFDKKELLLKEKYYVEQAFNEAAIANLEGDLAPSEKDEFEKYLSKHPEKQKEADLFQLTKLQADESVKFSLKRKLIHRSAGRTVLLWSARVAAVAIIALSVYNFMDKSSEKIITENQVSAIEKEAEKKPNSEEIKEIPVKIDSKEVQPKNEKTENPEIKKEKPKTQPVKSLRENSPGRLENDDLALVHINEEVPPKIGSLKPSVFVSLPKTELVPVKISIPEINEPMEEERLFVDVVKEKTWIGKLTFGNITKAGLSLVANLSNEKFNYETNAEGKITEVKYDSRILAFSVPTKNEVIRK
jgi:Ca2+-binding EF-hand superfamily protein